MAPWDIPPMNDLLVCFIFKEPRKKWRRLPRTSVVKSVLELVNPCLHHRLGRPIRDDSMPTSLRDARGQRWNVTHLVDGFCTRQYAQLSKNPASKHSCDLLFDKWITVHGPVSKLSVDGGPSSGDTSSPCADCTTSNWKRCRHLPNGRMGWLSAMGRCSSSCSSRSSMNWSSTRRVSCVMP